MKDKCRLDALLVERGLAPSREKAKALVMAGKVFSESERLDKPGLSCEKSLPLTVKDGVLPYVSRGGFKLAKAVAVFQLDFQGAVVVDLGASTGGFTDCALQNGAKKVYAVDVGYGQLAWTLRNDERVVCLERTNARYLEAGSLGELADWVICDVAFISVVKLLGAIDKITKPDGQVVLLLKPQFEAGRAGVGKHGVVRDPAVHKEVIISVLSRACAEGFTVKGLDFSPIRGPEGNIEFLAWLGKGQDGSNWLEWVDMVVKEAW